MSDTPEQDALDEYLRGMVMLEPAEWGAKGLPKREAWLRQASRLDGSPSATPPLDDREPASVELLMQSIRTLQERFWSEDSQADLDRLKSYSFANAPELAQVAHRMEAWHRVRPALNQLLLKLGEKSLAPSLLRMATMTSRELAAAKVTLSHGQDAWNAWRFRWQARRIRTQFPDIYALDPEWFEALMRP
jgi:hypothetical protein